MSIGRPARNWYSAISVAVLALCLTPFGFAEDSEWVKRVFDALHVPLFAAVSYLLIRVTNRTPSLKTALAVGVLVAIGSAVIELVQPTFGRSASMTDLLNGFLGILFGCCAAVLTGSIRARLLLSLCFLAVFFLALTPAYREYRIAEWRWRLLPTVADFEDDLGLRFWRPTGGARLSVSTEQLPSKSLLVQTTPGEWSGAGFHCGNSSWRGYTALTFTVYNDSADRFSLGVRIDDSRRQPGYDERFNTGIPLNPGHNTISIPLDTVARGPKNGRLDMDSIRRMVVFVAPEEPARRLFLDDFRLVNEHPLAPSE